MLLLDVPLLITLDFRLSRACPCLNGTNGKPQISIATRNASQMDFKDSKNKKWISAIFLELVKLVLRL